MARIRHFGLTGVINGLVSLSYILQNSIETVSVWVAGRLGPEEPSAAAFSVVVAFMTG